MAVILTTLETLQGAFTLAFVAISFILGLTIMLRYFKYKNRQFLLVGATWIFIVSPYWPDAINFIMILTTGTLITTDLYLIIASIFIPPLHITWIIAMTDIMYKKRQRLIVSIFTLEAILFEILLIVFYVVNISILGTQLAPFVVRYGDIYLFYLLISIILFLITGLFFVRESLKSNNKEVQLKGKIILIAFIVFTIGTLMDVIIDVPTELTIAMARILLILASFLLYVGFTLPNWAKKRLLK